MKLETLYKPTKTGATQVCDISYERNIFTVNFGQLDGKMQCMPTLCFPKNVGKANETSGEEQAALEAKAKWAKKVKGGYSTNKEAPVTVSLPQKVKPYIGNEHKIENDAYSTIKFNGMNATYWLGADNSLRITSRGGEDYPAIPHLEDAVRETMADAGTTCLNCELYIHGEHLQDINSAVRKTKELSKLLTFNVFEFPLMSIPYKNKVDILKRLEHAVNPIKVKSALEIETCYVDAKAKGYEGTVIYNAKAMYKFNTRSSDVYKYKKTVDREFKTVDYSLDKYGHAVYVCTTGKETFNVKRKGTSEERLEDAITASSNMGLWLNVEYEMLSKIGKPLKPVGNHFRKCDDSGEALE